MSEQASKRAKLVDPLAQGILSAESRAKYTKSYSEAKPYPHTVFSPIADPELFGRVREEIVTHLSTTYKETDLFKLYQTTDLANIDDTQPELSAKLPNLLRLRDALYSPEFRQFISDVTGCGKLTDRVDMAASAYARGCHLLCHDDVIGTRAVSFILYFSEEGWTEADGGALELYGLDKDTMKVTTVGPQGQPVPAPSARHLPLYNTMGIFRVTPGRSYHSVQEVLRDGSPRLSIQGWYHGEAAPEGAEMASLNQLKMANENKPEYKPLEDFVQRKSHSAGAEADDVQDVLTEEDVSYLSNWLNPTYLKGEAIAAVRKQFEQASSVQLRKFLREDLAKKIMDACDKTDQGDGLVDTCLPGDNVGVTASWKLVGPAHMQRYLQLQHSQTAASQSSSADTPSEAAARLMGDLQSKLMTSSSFGRFLSAVTQGRIRGAISQARRFRPGQDYTVAHHGLIEATSRLDATLCFVNDTTENNYEVWQNGEYGAFECYLAAEDEENEAAEVYCDDDAQGNDLLSVAASSNTLNLVLRDPGTMRFVKYVSGRAPGSRWDVSSVYEIEYDDDDEEDEGNNQVGSDLDEDDDVDEMQ